MNGEDQQPCEQTIQVATIFHPNHHDLETDLIFASSDNVYFYAHTSFIADASPTALESLLLYEIPAGMKQSVVSLSLSSPVLNIILHAFYNTSCAENVPSCDELIEAVDKLADLGLTLSSSILPDTPLYTILISHAPRRPLDIFALAAHHDLFELAQYTSSHLLTLSLSYISDEMSIRIGARYLKRMFVLQMSRSAALKELVMSVPSQYHTLTQACCAIEQQKQAFTRAWAMGASTLAWMMLRGTYLIACPYAIFFAELRYHSIDPSVHQLHSVYTKLGNELQCPDCRAAFDQHLEKAIFRWSEAKVSMDSQLLCSMTDLAPDYDLIVTYNLPPNENRAAHTHSARFPFCVVGNKSPLPPPRKHPSTSKTRQHPLHYQS